MQVLTDRERAASLSTPPTEGLAYTIAFFTEVIESYFAHQHSADYLLIDRGIYDLAVWADVRRSFKEITPIEQKALKATFERFKKMTDGVIYFSHPVTDSLNRHKKTKHEAVDDVAMNTKWLTVLSKSYKKQVFPKKKTFLIKGEQNKKKIHADILHFVQSFEENQSGSKKI